jgi:hypothetical protein
MNPSVAARRSQTSQWRPMLTSIKNSTGSIVAPIAQDVLNLGIAKDEEAQGSSVVLHRIKGRMNLSRVDAQLPPALARNRRLRLGLQVHLLLLFEGVSRSMILNLEAEKAVDSSKRFGVLSGYP